MPMMSERDNVCSMKFTEIKGDNLFYQMKSIKDDRYPMKKNVVRMYLNITVYLRPHQTIPNAVEFTEICQIDLKGHFPARLINMIMTSQVKTEIENLYHYVKDKQN